MGDSKTITSEILKEEFSTLGGKKDVSHFIQNDEINISEFALESPQLILFPSFLQVPHQIKYTVKPYFHSYLAVPHSRWQSLNVFFLYLAIPLKLDFLLLE